MALRWTGTSSLHLGHSLIRELAAEEKGCVSVTVLCAVVCECGSDNHLGGCVTYVSLHVALCTWNESVCMPEGVFVLEVV